MEFAREQYLQQLIDSREDGLIKVITGIRRAGKSYLLNEIFYRWLCSSVADSQHVVRFAFDSLEDAEKIEDSFNDASGKMKKRDASKFLTYINSRMTDEGMYYLLLDEVQNLESFEGVLNGLQRRRNVDIYVTGSNSRFLSTDILTEFRGRGEEIHVFPLTFREYVQGTGLTPEDAWREYLITGGIPLVAGLRQERQKEQYLKALCDEVYLRDIVARNKVKNEVDLSDLLDVTASMMASITNPTRITNTFNAEKKKNISDDTIHSYLRYFEEAFLISKVKRYDIEGRRYINAGYKFYFEDIGIRNARLNFRQLNETHLMENVIYNELRARGLNVDIGALEISEKTDRLDKNGKVIYTKKQLEVDFIATAGSRKYYIQSAWALPDEEKEQQEKRPLVRIHDSFRKIVVVNDHLRVRRDETGVTTLSLFDFLLDEHSLDI